MGAFGGFASCVPQETEPVGRECVGCDARIRGVRGSASGACVGWLAVLSSLACGVVIAAGLAGGCRGRCVLPWIDGLRQVTSNPGSGLAG